MKIWSALEDAEHDHRLDVTPEPDLGLAWAVSGIRPIDADVYWQASLDHLYEAQAWMPGHELAYLYPPPLAQAMTISVAAP